MKFDISKDVILWQPLKVANKEVTLEVSQVDTSMDIKLLQPSNILSMLTTFKVSKRDNSIVSNCKIT